MVLWMMGKVISKLNTLIPHNNYFVLSNIIMVIGNT